MTEQITTRKGLLVSAAAHAALLLWLALGPSIAPPVRVRPMGTHTGTVEALVYDPGGIAAPAAQEVAPPTRHSDKSISLARLRKAASKAPEKPSNSPAQSGDSPLGDGDVSVALMRYFPDPQPDLSSLPHGTDGNVIIEVLIDAQGHIASASLVQGLGDAVDKAVLATLQTWTFAPATKDGIAVASKQEIVFHYQRS